MKHVIIDRPRIGGDGGKGKPPKGSKRRWQRIPVEDQLGKAEIHKLQLWKTALGKKAR